MNKARTLSLSAFGALGAAVFFVFLFNDFGVTVSLLAFGVYLVALIFGLRIYYRRRATAADVSGVPHKR